ncbi:MAG: hypothetical protein N838_26915 [Thiohalocapsa sp. PB-PSB1]|jgi:hypothetical protein|nr:MAG: hypothetical protein N838_14635 [Thiohalocapsa sp. PB-PSB1]QQO56453.1 MAG: hypothetical protein N838_26915 [Thiohalocapsa sp. PB-PSB1]HCS92174.1 hypothetical protein [Chromatiaceae bacterium]
MPSKNSAPIFACSLFAAGLLAGGAASISAAEIALSNLTFSNFSIAPDSGAVDLLTNWEIEAYAEARNSLGEIDQDDEVSFNGGTVDANARVTWAEANASASAPSGNTPTLDVTGNANTDVEVPGEPKCKPAKWAYAESTGTLVNGFSLSGGSGSVPVTFSVNLDSSMAVSTDDCSSAQAWTELIFSFEIFDLVDNLVFFERDRIECNGPNCSLTSALAPTLTTTRTLEFGTDYFFALQVDSESRAEVPLSPTALLLLAGLPLLARGRNRRHE